MLPVFPRGPPGQVTEDGEAGTIKGTLSGGCELDLLHHMRGRITADLGARAGKVRAARAPAGLDTTGRHVLGYAVQDYSEQKTDM